jgi:hypothetical protein
MGNSLCWGLVGLISVGVVGCSVAASPDFNGNWKLSQSKSSIPGPNIVLTKASTGQYHLEGPSGGFDFGCDGNEYSSVQGGSISCREATQLAMDMWAKDSHGKLTIAHWALSEDGKTLTIKPTYIEPGSQAKAEGTVYERMSGTGGFAGGWRDTKRLESGAQSLLLVLNGRSLHVGYPDKAQYADLVLGGPDAPLHGPSMPSGRTISMKTQGARQFAVRIKLDGRLVSQGTYTISSNGRTLVEEWSRPGYKGEPAHLVWEKQ